MSGRFLIVVDADISLVRITTSGFFDAKDIELFDEARVAAYRRLRCKLNRHCTLVDIREMAIQTQEVTALFRDMAVDPRTASRAMAVVAAHSLARMQMKRVVEGKNVAFFHDDLAAAERWLTEQRSMAA